MAAADSGVPVAPELLAFRIDKWRGRHCEWVSYDPTPKEEEEELTSLNAWQAQRSRGGQMASEDSEKSPSEKLMEGGESEDHELVVAGRADEADGSEESEAVNEGGAAEAGGGGVEVGGKAEGGGGTEEGGGVEEVKEQK